MQQAKLLRKIKKTKTRLCIKLHLIIGKLLNADQNLTLSLKIITTLTSKTLIYLLDLGIYFKSSQTILF